MVYINEVQWLSTCLLHPNNNHTRRKLPSTFEGNKQEQTLGPTTTFKNWASEIQIYMSLEDHNLSTITHNVKTQTRPINDDNQGLLHNFNNNRPKAELLLVWLLSGR
eukprot:4568772-Amphidinium_carterae.1